MKINMARRLWRSNARCGLMSSYLIWQLRRVCCLSLCICYCCVVKQNAEKQKLTNFLCSGLGLFSLKSLAVFRYGAGRRFLNMTSRVIDSLPWGGARSVFSYSWCGGFLVSTTATWMAIGPCIQVLRFTMCFHVIFLQSTWDPIEITDI